MKDAPLYGSSDPLSLFSRFTPLEGELVPLPSARGRVLAENLVMVKQTRACEAGTVVLGENLIPADEDYAPGVLVLAQGSRLRPQDLGALASQGIMAVPVYRRPKVAILSTGNELVAADRMPSPGQIRDINSTILAAQVEEAGGLPLPYGICGDDIEDILAVCTHALAEADVLLLSGGSSRGRRDCTLQVFKTIPQTELLTHGVSVPPGKASILARQGNKALFGLPGPVASAIMTFYLFVRPLLRQYTGLGATLGLQTIRAITEQHIPSSIGREEHIRVRLTAQKNGALPLATPLYGKSGLLNPLVRADGLLPISREVDGLHQGSEVTILLFP